jgi:hypothetical protein
MFVLVQDGIVVSQDDDLGNISELQMVMQEIHPDSTIIIFPADDFPPVDPSEENVVDIDGATD